MSKKENPIRVLVVDDSAVVRQVLTTELSKYDDIEVVGTAVDPYAARDKIVQLKPDVLTLDIEMPRMDGLSFLARLMKHHPLPVIILSSLTEEKSETALRALELGALEVFHKPKSRFSVADDIAELVRALREARSAKVSQPVAAQNVGKGPKAQFRDLVHTHKLLAIGASTGGTQAIEAVLRELPVNTPGTLIVQHMPEHFTRAFAERLNKVSEMEVREARHGDVVATGTALIAPGGYHMRLRSSGAMRIVDLDTGPMVHHQRPAVDILFQSIADGAARNAVGVILTGMGADGARGLRAMRDAGARTLAQDENSCVVFGMPREAIRLGAAEHIVPLPEMAGAILNCL
jgi:two-component system, chemotaxis family, protein-glutamate methylesterase/glutaminase